MEITATPTTELEAINQMLRSIGETPVSSITDDSGIEVPVAIDTLKEISRAVQVEGWEFNTETDYPLLRDIDGLISVPRNALSVDFSHRKYHTNHPTVRGLRVYDRKNHTYTFDMNLKATIIFGLPFEELPEAARFYIAYRAARKFQDNQTGSEVLHKFTENDEYRARAVFVERHADDQDLNMIRDTPDFAHLQ